MASTYSTVDDLMLGDLPVGSYVSKQKYVDDAADEIDSYIGHIYATPIDMSVGSPVSRPSRLLVARIARFLSTGRLILAIATPSQHQVLHAYGAKMVDEALAALNALAEGDPPLVGADPANPAKDVLESSGPLVSNIDTRSTVETFYQVFADPYAYPEGARDVLY